MNLIYFINQNLINNESQLYKKKIFHNEHEVYPNDLDGSFYGGAPSWDESQSVSQQIKEALEQQNMEKVSFSVH